MSLQVAIVILNYNGRRHLETFLPSVVATTYPGRRIIVADNASTDESVAFLRSGFPEVELIQLPVNLGFAGGYNAALAGVQSDIYVLLNSDVLVTPDWVQPVVRLMESRPTVAVCQPKLRAYLEQDHFEYAGAAGGWIDSLGYPFARGRVFQSMEPDRGQYDDSSAIFWASGAAMFVRSSHYHALGGLDEFFFAHQEEIDFCWRTQRAGSEVWCCPASCVYHLGGGTLSRGNSRKEFLNFRNNMIMLMKNLPFSGLIWKVPVRFGLDALFAWKVLFQGDLSSFLAVLRAHFAVLGWLFRPSKGAKDSGLRLPRLASRRLAGCYRGVLVWDYFVRKHDKFPQIVSGS